MVRILFWAPIVTVLLVWGAFSSDVLGIDWKTIGLRGGISDNRNEEDFNFVRHWAIGYRFQHMSNFVFYDSNPGLDLHMIEISYLF